MKLMEAERVKWLIFKEYAVTISATVDKQNPLDVEVRHIRNALDAWLRKRGSKCWRVCIQITSEPADFDKITSAIKDMADHLAILKKLHTKLTLFNQKGVQCSDIDLNSIKSASPGPNTPKKEAEKK